MYYSIMSIASHNAKNRVSIRQLGDFLLYTGDTFEAKIRYTAWGKKKPDSRHYDHIFQPISKILVSVAR